MKALSPGDPFTIELSNGQEVQAVALSFRQERAITALEDEARGFEKATDVWDFSEKAVRLALPKTSEEEITNLLDKLNLQLVQELIKKVLHHQSLTGDDKKKPESPR